MKGRALEGLGFAYEVKAQADAGRQGQVARPGAQEFRALENTDVKGFKELGMYHQARVAEAKGDKDKAITSLKALHERLEAPGENHPFVYLETVADDRLRAARSHARSNRSRRLGRHGRRRSRWRQRYDPGADQAAHRADSGRRGGAHAPPGGGK